MAFFPSKAALGKVKLWHLNLFVGHGWGSAPRISEVFYVVAVCV